MTRTFVGDTECTPLCEAVRPEADRDQLGVIGEALWQLADQLEQLCPEVLVPKELPPTELVKRVETILKNLPTAEEEQWRDRHRIALHRLQERAINIVV
jgi:hypothetical protein